MLRISGVRLEINEEKYKQHLENLTGWKIQSVQMVKKSVDARNKKHLCFEYIFDVEVSEDEQVALKKSKYKNVELTPVLEKYFPEPVNNTQQLRPVVVGTGPAGMMAGLALAKAGLKPILIERGQDVKNRKLSVELFWKTGKLNSESNVQFGEGGAGTFSDGKLTTGIKKDAYTYFVLDEFIQCGAPEEILYSGKPHIGTDKLAPMVENIRQEIINLGGEYLFNTKLIDLVVKNNEIIGIKILKNNSELEEISTKNVILAVGHSSRDTFEMLYKRGVFLEQKAFAVGVRIEHLQRNINLSRYGIEELPAVLSAADYKLAVHIGMGDQQRGVYTFCMCPGGYVVAATSEEHKVVTNGMSYFDRAGINANSALLVEVKKSDFKSDHPLAGIEYQRKIEENAYINGGKNYYAPIQRVEDFLVNKVSNSLGEVSSTYTPGTNFVDMRAILPVEIVQSIKMAKDELNQKMPKFLYGDAILVGAETRSSSPVRILRDMQTFQSISVSGLYPAGEGAGYAGGIMSAAVDGVKCADKIIQKYK